MPSAIRRCARPGSDRAWAFVSTLEAPFNSLKAHLLYQRLDHARTRGRVRCGPVSRVRQAAAQRLLHQSRLAARPAGVELSGRSGGGFFRGHRRPPIGNDDALVRDYLLRLLAAAHSPGRLCAVFRRRLAPGGFCRGPADRRRGRPETRRNPRLRAVVRGLRRPQTAGRPRFRPRQPGPPRPGRCRLARRLGEKCRGRSPSRFSNSTRPRATRRPAGRSAPTSTSTAWWRRPSGRWRPRRLRCGASGIRLRFRNSPRGAASGWSNSSATAAARARCCAKGSCIT